MRPDWPPSARALPGPARCLAQHACLASDLLWQAVNFIATTPPAKGLQRTVMKIFTFSLLLNGSQDDAERRTPIRSFSLTHTPMTDHIEFRITPAFFFFKWKISFIMFTYVGEWTINKTNQIIIRIIIRITKSRLFFFLWEIFQYSTTTKQKTKKRTGYSYQPLQVWLSLRKLPMTF